MAGDATDAILTRLERTVEALGGLLQGESGLITKIVLIEKEMSDLRNSVDMLVNTKTVEEAKWKAWARWGGAFAGFFALATQIFLLWRASQ